MDVYESITLGRECLNHVAVALVEKHEVRLKLNPQNRQEEE